jgi:hypothetical protein
MKNDIISTKAMYINLQQGTIFNPYIIICQGTNFDKEPTTT